MDMKLLVLILIVIFYKKKEIQFFKLKLLNKNYWFYLIYLYCKNILIEIMAYLIVKVALAALLFSAVLSQVLPNDGLGKYQQQSCCPQGYNVAGAYCVKCNAPKHWDAVSQRCVACEPGHTWDNNTHECTCC
jgi:hypothetical protein